MNRQRPIKANEQINAKNVFRVDSLNVSTDAVALAQYNQINTKVATVLASVGYTPQEIDQFRQATILYAFNKPSIFDDYLLYLGQGITLVGRRNIASLTMTTDEYVDKRAIILPASFTGNRYRDEQWGLVLHMQYTLVVSGSEEDAHDAGYKMELAYRAAYNATVPPPPGQPANFLFKEADYEAIQYTERKRQKLYGTGPPW